MSNWRKSFERIFVSKCLNKRNVESTLGRTNSASKPIRFTTNKMKTKRKVLPQKRFGPVKNGSDKTRSVDDVFSKRSQKCFKCWWSWFNRNVSFCFCKSWKSSSKTCWRSTVKSNFVSKKWIFFPIKPKNFLTNSKKNNVVQRWYKPKDMLMKTNVEFLVRHQCPNRKRRSIDIRSLNKQTELKIDEQSSNLRYRCIETIFFDRYEKHKSKNVPTTHCLRELKRRVKCNEPQRWKSFRFSFSPFRCSLLFAMSVRRTIVLIRFEHDEFLLEVLNDEKTKDEKNFERCFSNRLREHLASISVNQVGKVFWIICNSSSEICEGRRETIGVARARVVPVGFVVNESVLEEFLLTKRMKNHWIFTSWVNSDSTDNPLRIHKQLELHWPKQKIRCYTNISNN